MNDSWLGSSEQLLLFCVNQRKRVIAVTSPYKGTGVSTCVRTLAGTAAQSGYSPIVVDLSLAASDDGPADGTGLQNGASADGLADHAPFRTVEVRLSKAERASSSDQERLRSRLGELLGNHDFALIDVPSLLDRDPKTFNALAALTVSDCVLLLCEPGKITPSVLQGCLDRVRLAGAKIDGLVLNEGRTPHVGAQIARTLRILLWFIPPLARWAERRVRRSPLFD